MSSGKTDPLQRLQRLLSILIAVSVIAWSTRNFWINIGALRDADGPSIYEDRAMGTVWLFFMAAFVLAPFGLGVFLLWRALSQKKEVPLNR